MARIGELLLQHGWVDATTLRRALSEQSLTGGKRLCSLLIARGLLDPDNAARALGEQHDLPAVLQRHLEHRERGLVHLLPATFARAHFALPIGRTRNGDLIVCVRDPSPNVQAAIRRAINATIVIAIAPASQLEHLIDVSYEDSGEAEFDVDLSTGTGIAAPTSGSLLDPVPDDEPSMPDIGVFSLVELDDVRVNKNVTRSQAELKLPPRTTPPPFNSVTPPFGSLTPPTQPPRSALPPRTTPPVLASSPFASITPPFATPRPAPLPSPPAKVIEPELEPDDLEDVEEMEPDFESELPPVRPSEVLKTAITAPSTARAPAPRVMIPPIGEPLPSRPAALRTPPAPVPQVRLTIHEVVDAIADAVSRDIATDVAMRFAGQRWTASLLLAVKEGAALGHRGHGPQLGGDAVRAVAIPLTTPSIVKAAHDTKKLVTDTPSGAGAIHERIVRLLGQPRTAIAAPIVVAGRIACVFAVGDINGAGDSASDLDRLTTALGDAYTRILRDQK